MLITVRAGALPLSMPNWDSILAYDTVKVRHLDSRGEVPPKAVWHRSAMRMKLIRFSPGGLHDKGLAGPCPRRGLVWCGLAGCGVVGGVAWRLLCGVVRRGVM